MRKLVARGAVLGSVMMLMLAGWAAAQDDAEETGSTLPTMDSPFGADFKYFTASVIGYKPSGALELKDSVHIELADITVKCNRATFDPTTKVLRAEGTPVEIDQPG